MRHTDSILVHQTDEISLSKKARWRGDSLPKLTDRGHELVSLLEVRELFPAPLVVGIYVQEIPLEND